MRKTCFSKRCACPDDNFTYKSFTCGSDPIKNGQLTNDLLNVNIFLNNENENL